MHVTRIKPVFNSDADPHVGADVVHRNSSTVGVHDPKVILGAGEPLFSGKSVPANCFLVVLGYTPTKLVHDPKVTLGGS